MKLLNRGLKKNILWVIILFFTSIISLKAQVAEGNLVKGSKDPVYLIVNGKACWISSSELFGALGLDWKNVKKISDAELKKIPQDWLIIKGNDKPVYVINNGVACKISDIQTLILLGFDKNSIRKVSDEMLRKIPQQPILVKGSDDPIYLINNGQACWIQSEKIFNALGYDIKRVIRINDNILLKIAKSPLLLKGEDKKIYLTDKEKRYWITTEGLFNKLGYNWNAVLSIDNKYLKKIVEGEPIR
jgi:hypothetical protein